MCSIDDIALNTCGSCNQGGNETWQRRKEEETIQVVESMLDSVDVDDSVMEIRLL